MTPTQSGDILRDKHWALVYFYGCGGMHTPHPKLGAFHLLRISMDRLEARQK